MTAAAGESLVVHSPKHPGKRYHAKNYKMIAVPGHPSEYRGDGLIYDHRYRAAKALGRELPPGVVVHHVTGGKSNGGLVICQDQAYHALLHIRARAYTAMGDPRKRKCPFCQSFDDIENMVEYVCKNHPNGVYRHATCAAKYKREAYNVKGSDRKD